MDAQTRALHTHALAALVQTIAHLELEEGYCSHRLIHAVEILDENRFLAARDGMAARLIDPVAERRVPAAELLAQLLKVGRPHAEELGCEDALDSVSELARQTGAARQLEVGRERGLRGLVESLAWSFA
jgi:carboxylate-amine ligase